MEIPPIPYNYDLWEHMVHEHGLSLLESELSEIEDHSARVKRLESELSQTRERLNECVDALAEMTQVAESQKWNNGEILNAQEALANAKKPL